MKPRNAAQWLLAVSIASCVAISVTIRKWPAAPWTGSSELAALTAETERLQDATDEAVASWRQKAAAATRIGWSLERLEEFEQALGPSWQCKWEDHQEPGFRVAVISRSPAPLHAWKEILVLAQSLEARPGLSIEKVAIAVVGSGTERRFGGIAFTVRIAWANQGNAARPASLGSRPVSGPLAPARSREAGAAAHALRPEASPAHSRRARPSGRRTPATREVRRFLG